jgi:hypothetical protein
MRVIGCMSEKPPYVDLLEEDKPIAQQKFVCVSFVSPENIIQQKEHFFFDRFVKTWDLVKSMQKYAQFTAFLAYKYNLDPEQVTTDLNEFCKEESVTLAKESVADDYKTYLEKYVEDLELEYNKKNDFQTNTRGIKIRGVFPSQEEAEIRAKLLRENDPHFDVYVGPVGVWMPWEPDAYRTGQVHFLESQLNELMSKKQQNEASAKEYFDKRVKEAKRKAIEENVRKARESGNKLSQSIDANDNLVNVKNVADIQKTLFETENVVTDKNSDHGLSELKNSIL